jgi:hypothetical protein
VLKDDFLPLHGAATPGEMPDKVIISLSLQKDYEIGPRQRGQQVWPFWSSAISGVHKRVAVMGNNPLFPGYDTRQECSNTYCVQKKLSKYTYACLAVPSNTAILTLFLEKVNLLSPPK